jgi:two-component system, sensor histidine kinase
MRTYFLCFFAFLLLVTGLMPSVVALGGGPRWDAVAWLAAALVAGVAAYAVAVHRPLARLSEAARAWRGGNFTPRIPSRVAGSMSGLAKDLNAMADANARYQALFERAIDAMVVIDDKGIIQCTNPAAEHLFGYAEGALTGRNLAMLMPEVLRSGKPEIIPTVREVVGLRADSSTVCLDLSIAAWREGGRCLFGCIMRDISARVAAQNLSQESEARFRTVFEQAAVGIEMVGLDGRFIDANRVSCEMLGYSRQELLVRSIEQVTDAVDLPLERRLISEMRDGTRSTFVVDKRRRRKDGTRVWVRVSSSVPRAGVVAFPYRISVVEDITERKAMEEQLRTATARLQMALEGARAGTWEWDVETGRMAWSVETYRLNGLNSAVAPSREVWLSAVESEDRGALALVERDIFARRDARYAVDMRVTHPETGLRWLAAMGRITYSATGQPQKIIGILIDITELKAAEQAAKEAKDEAEKANRTKSRFLAAASHDLRQPVQAMVLLTAALGGRLKDHPATEVVTSMQSSLEALQMLLEALLDVSRLDAGGIKPNKRPVEIVEVLKRLGTEYTFQAERKGLRLRVQGGRGGGVVLTDPALLERILRNLIENAIRYTDHGGILVGCRQRRGRLLIQVVDSGIGIPFDQQEAVFNEFYQVESPDRDRGKGLGLGLSIVRRLARLLDHRITVVSRQGRGTCFTLELPLDGGKVAPVVPAVCVALGGEEARGGGLILVIDDESLVRSALASVVESWGCEAFAVASAADAVAWIRRSGRCPDAIIADYRLAAGHVGTSAIHEVQLACGRKVPAVIITGDTAPERIVEASRSGFQIAHKPVKPERLREMVVEARRRA